MKCHEDELLNFESERNFHWYNNAIHCSRSDNDDVGAINAEHAGAELIDDQPTIQHDDNNYQYVA